MTKSIILIALAGAVGAVARYLVVWFASWFELDYWGTFIVNITGCFLIGVAIAYFGDSDWFKSVGRPLIVIGFLGAFTTFSAFSMDTFQLVQSGKLATALIYTLLTVGGCLIATWSGYRLASF